MTYFVLLLATLCIELAMNLPIGSLPLLLDDEHVSRSYISMAMGAGMLTAVFASIPIGAYVDRIGRLTSMKIALFLAFLALLGLYVAQGAMAGATLMGLRSVAMIAFMTAQAAYVSVFVPEEKSVSAVATMGITGNIAFALAPAMGVWLWQHGCMRDQFLWATLVIIVGAIIVWRLPKVHDTKSSGDTKHAVFRKSWIPGLTFNFAASLQGGVNGALAVLTFHDRGIENGALLFTASACTTVFLRYFASVAVEKCGARRVAVPTAIAQGLGCLLAAGAHTTSSVIAAGICFGFAWAFVVPVILECLLNQSEVDNRGAAMGCCHFTFGAGAALGAIIATVATANNYGYAEAISICAVAPALALPLLLLSKTPRTPLKAEPAVMIAE